MNATTISDPDMHMTSGDDEGGCFDCNICLEPACDPVVTTCGHLYCWPCICRWSRAQNGGDHSVAAQQDGRKIACPVCRNYVDMNCSLIPLYGRGSSSRLSSSHGDGTGHDIPLRLSRTQPSRAVIADPADVDTCFDPAAGIGRRNNCRARREEMKLEKSLNRVSVFLLCCAFMCLLAF
ncbi:hypothetical protein MLD38_035206 [Melastoma candidum]|uniref:Uncharacterized protein n=1 Tax=Melastoma candidum TaxID=119954 RepID=A0ACB9MFZ9_9MYRT|nr:hypothetical protein MLD38_035206 [Melastoma candidum]